MHDFPLYLFLNHIYLKNPQEKNCYPSPYCFFKHRAQKAIWGNSLFLHVLTKNQGFEPIYAYVINWT
ncbi:MAG TPA: hypothetical protein DDW90_06950 [Cyanobacteria bacterium UBA9971]|nr:hypothetical protein [Cyanobacteria bacterium UBA9971]